MEVNSKPAAPAAYPYKFPLDAKVSFWVDAPIGDGRQQQLTGTIRVRYVMPAGETLRPHYVVMTGPDEFCDVPEDKLTAVD